jgi:hypothetical protein
MGPERGIVPGETSCELEQLSIAISVVEETIRVMPYISEEPKFIRERYILVAEIVTMIILGSWGICVAEGIRNR